MLPPEKLVFWPAWSMKIQPPLSEESVATAWVVSLTPFPNPSIPEKNDATFVVVIWTETVQFDPAYGPELGGLLTVTVTLPPLVNPLPAASSVAAVVAEFWLGQVPPYKICWAPPMAAASVAACCAF